MQDNKSHKIKKLASPYSLGEYEKIFFPKWLYRFWPYQQVFMWGLFFISIIIYLFILSMTVGYKVNLKIFKKYTYSDKTTKSSIKEISDVVNVYPVGGAIIKSNTKNSIITLKSKKSINTEDVVKLKSGKFISLPVGIYDISLLAPKKFAVTGKILIGRELVYKDFIYLFNKPLVLLSSIPLTEVDNTKNNTVNPQINKKNIFISKQNDKNSFIFVVYNVKNSKYILTEIKYYDLFKKFKKNSTDITYLIVKCEKFFKEFSLNNFYYWQKNLIFLSKNKICVANLLSKKINTFNLGVSVKYNYFMGDDYFYVYKNYSNILIKISSNGKILRKEYKQKGWFNLFEGQFYFWTVKTVNKQGIILTVYRISDDFRLDFIQRISIPVNYISQIGFWNKDFIFLIQKNRFILYPLSDVANEQLFDFYSNKTNKSFFAEYKNMNNSYRHFKLKSYILNNGIHKFYIYSYLPNYMFVNQIREDSTCVNLVSAKNLYAKQDYKGIVCFSDDLVIHANKPSGIYYLKTNGVVFNGHNVILFVKKDNRNLNIFARYLFINSPIIKIREFAIKDYEFLGIFKDIIVVYNKEKNILQMFKL